MFATADLIDASEQVIDVRLETVSRNRRPGDA